MHFCYLIINETGRNTYVGYTINPTKRLRQHNGEIKGGAKYTSRNGRAWQYIAIISSPAFDNHLALSLEWHMKEHKRGRKRDALFNPITNRIALLQKALQHEKFKDLHIWLHVANPVYKDAFSNAFITFKNVDLV
jgi:predicted GIY-YIG superfamily endonuclease